MPMPGERSEADAALQLLSQCAETRESMLVCTSSAHGNRRTRLTYHPGSSLRTPQVLLCWASTWYRYVLPRSLFPCLLCAQARAGVVCLVQQVDGRRHLVRTHSEGSEFRKTETSSSVPFLRIPHPFTQLHPFTRAHLRGTSLSSFGLTTNHGRGVRR